jgi:hypothetical protein
VRKREGGEGGNEREREEREGKRERGIGRERDGGREIERKGGS